MSITLPVCLSRRLSNDYSRPNYPVWGESVVNWVRNTGRKQRVVVEGKESSWRPEISGLPQGLVLGPVLFIIYIHDLENETGSSILKFADDANIFRTV